MLLSPAQVRRRGYHFVGEECGIIVTHRPWSHRTQPDKVFVVFPMTHWIGCVRVTLISITVWTLHCPIASSCIVPKNRSFLRIIHMLACYHFIVWIWYGRTNNRLKRRNQHYPQCSVIWLGRTLFFYSAFRPSHSTVTSLEYFEGLCGSSDLCVAKWIIFLYKLIIPNGFVTNNYWSCISVVCLVNLKLFLNLYLSKANPVRRNNCVTKWCLNECLTI